MRQISRSGLTLAALLLCAGAAGCALPSSGRTVRDKDNGATVQLRTGEKLTVALEANQTTGYMWEATGTPPAVLKPEGSTYQQDAAAPGIVGAGGTATFEYSAVSAGEGTLALVYVRPWEKGVPPARRFEIRVVVR